MSPTPEITNVELIVIICCMAALFIQAAIQSWMDIKSGRFDKRYRKWKREAP